MAFAQRRQRGLFDPDAAPGAEPVRPPRLRARLRRRHHGGRLVTRPARSPATRSSATSRVIYDANQISIEDDTDIAFTEDVGQALRGLRLARRQTVDWRRNRGGRRRPTSRTSTRCSPRSSAGKQVTDKPTLIVLHTIIAWPAPTKQNTGKSHGSALGDDEVAATKKLLGFDPEQTFEVERRRPRPRPRGRRRAARPPHARVAEALRRVAQGQPRARRAARPPRSPASCPTGLDKALPVFPAEPRAWPPAPRPARSSRRSADVMPELWGGSADLAESNNTTMEGVEPSFIPTSRQTQRVEGRPLRPHPALRHPRARHGHDPQRHRARGPDPPLRRHVPRLLRLHAPRRAARRDPAAARHLRLDARLDRPRRGRPDPPADRAPRRAARHPGPRRRPPGRRQRDRGRVAHHPRPHATGRPAWP